MTGSSNGSHGNGSNGTTRWSDSELNRLRTQADPTYDQLVEDYRDSHPRLSEVRGDAEPRQVRELVKAMTGELGKAKRNPSGYPADMANPENVSSLLVRDSRPKLPDWASDVAQIERGQDVFRENGIYQVVALFFASLPMAYATEDGAKVLRDVSDLVNEGKEEHLERRVAETGQMLLDVMGMSEDLKPGIRHSLEPGGPGYATALGLRILHACARLLIREQKGSERWQEERFGPPINQELLLATLLDFTVVTWAAMDRMGVGLSREDREAHLYTWSIVGYLMGVEACQDGPLTLDDVDQLKPLLARRHLGKSEDGKRLMSALLIEMEKYMPLGWRKFPRSLVRWLFQNAPGDVKRVPDWLGVGRAAWWAVPLFSWLRAANLQGRKYGPLRWVIRRAGQHILIEYTDRRSQGDAPFRVPGLRVPPQLAEDWRVRKGHIARGVRERRRRVRQTMRRPAQGS